MMVEYQNSLLWLWPALRKLGASWDFLEYLSTALQPPQCWLLTYFQDFKFHCCWRIQNTKRVANAHISNVQSFMIMQCGVARYGRLSVNSSSGHCFPIFPIFHIQPYSNCFIYRATLFLFIQAQWSLIIWLLNQYWVQKFQMSTIPFTEMVP